MQNIFPLCHHAVDTPSAFNADYGVMEYFRYAPHTSTGVDGYLLTREADFVTTESAIYRIACPRRCWMMMMR